MQLEAARKIVCGTLAEARKLNLKPLAVAVLDAGGHLVCFEREDGAGIARYDISFAKAWGSLAMGFGSRELSKRSLHNPTFFTMLTTVTSGRMAASPGGILIADGSGMVIGAVGVSGDLGEQDEACALAGLVAAGLADADRLDD